jgi:hypothetical protein
MRATYAPTTSSTTPRRASAPAVEAVMATGARSLHRSPFALDRVLLELALFDLGDGSSNGIALLPIAVERKTGLLDVPFATPSPLPLA